MRQYRGDHHRCPLPLNLLSILIFNRGSTDGIVGILIGMFGFIASAILFASPKGLFLFDLPGAMSDFNKRFSAFLVLVGVESEKVQGYRFDLPLSLLLWLVAGLIAGSLVMPCLRFSFNFIHVHIKHQDQRFYTTYFLYIEPFLTLFVIFSYIRPLSILKFLQIPFFSPCTTGVDLALCNPKLPLWTEYFLPLTKGRWFAIQSLAIFALIFIRFALTRWNLQSYLETACVYAVTLDLEKKDIDTKSLQYRFTMRFNALMAVTIQYLSPTILLASLYLILMSKYAVAAEIPENLRECSALMGGEGAFTGLNSTVLATLKGPIDLETVQSVVVGLLSYPILSPMFYREVVSFFIFWTLSTWFFVYFIAAVYWARKVRLDNMS